MAPASLDASTAAAAPASQQHTFAAQQQSSVCPWSRSAPAATPMSSAAATATTIRSPCNVSAKSQSTPMLTSTAIGSLPSAPSSLKSKRHRVAAELNSAAAKRNRGDKCEAAAEATESKLAALSNTCSSNCANASGASAPLPGHIFNPPNVGSQTKITGFFKSQMKTTTVPVTPSAFTKKDLTHMTIRSADFPSTSSCDGLRTICAPLTVATVTAISSHHTRSEPTQAAVRSLAAPARKVERKMAKVAPLAPISRKPAAATKKSYPPVLPKKHVNIAPRTPNKLAADHAKNAAAAATSNQLQLLKHQHHQQKATAILQPKMSQSAVLLAAIRIPATPALTQAKQMPAVSQSLTISHPKIQPTHIHTTPSSSSPMCKSIHTKSSSSQSKLNGSIYQLHSAPVMPKLVQIPNVVSGGAQTTVAKDTTAATPATSNLVINNGATHFFLNNGTVIKLQQMAPPQEQQVRISCDSPSALIVALISFVADDERSRREDERKPFIGEVSSSSHIIIAIIVAARSICFLFACFKQSKRFLFVFCAQDTQTLAAHNDLTTHFAATAGPSAPQFGQPLFMATSSGLLQTTAVYTMLAPHHLSNLTPQQIPALQQYGQQTAPGLATQFLSNHGGLSFAMAPSGPVPPAPNTTPMPAHYLSKSDTSNALLGNLSISKAPKAMLQTTIAASMPATTSTTAVMATTTTPMAIVNPQKSLQSGPPPLAPAFPLLSQPTAGNFIVNKLPTRDPSTTIAPGTFLQPSPLPEHTPPHGTAITASVTKRMHDVVEATIPTVSATAPLATQATKTKREPKPAPTVTSLTAAEHKPDEAAAAPPTIDAFEFAKEPKDVLKIQTSIESEQLKTAAIESSKSPILSQPKTIRFPVNDRHGSRRHDSRVTGCCYWDECKTKCDSSSNLHDHLQTQHVNTQAGPFTCRWLDCKVKGRESCSRKWLERHVLSHGGSKVYKCIFEKCRMRFGSQVSEEAAKIDFQSVWQTENVSRICSWRYRSTSTVTLTARRATRTPQCVGTQIRRFPRSCAWMASACGTAASRFQVILLAAGHPTRR